MKHKRVSVLIIVLTVAAGILATTGVALAGWVWCDDPVLSIGGTPVYVKYEASIDGKTQDLQLSDYFTVSMDVSLPEGVSFAVPDPQGWIVASRIDRELEVSKKGIEADFIVLVLPKPGASAAGFGDDTKIKVSISLDGSNKVVGEGHVGEIIHIDNYRVPVPSGRE